MTSPTIQVRIDDRVRLMSAVLSATSWPETEQMRRRYRAHVHARKTTTWVYEFADHPAVETLQALLEQNIPLGAIYTYALSLSWPELTESTSLLWVPPHWDEQLADFYEKTELAAWWAEENDVWQRAYEETRKVLVYADVYGFFRPFIGEVAERLVLMPNVSYPSDSELGVRLQGELFCITPPRIAWGDNEPWPFDEDAAHIFRGALSEYGRLLMVSYLRHRATEVAQVASKPLPVDDRFRETHPTWGDQLTELFVMGAVALFLEEAIGPKESKAYMLMEHRVRSMTILPGVVSVLKRYLGEYQQGRYNQFADYLPNFAKHLRVARRVVSL